MVQDFEKKLRALCNCQPSSCLKQECLLFREEVQKCDAKRFLAAFVREAYDKLDKADTYDPFDV